MRFFQVAWENLQRAPQGDPHDAAGRTVLDRVLEELARDEADRVGAVLVEADRMRVDDGVEGGTLVGVRCLCLGSEGEEPRGEDWEA